ncbi:hypothetical protein GCM10022221_45120 [Actinocorallia aurea]
MAVGCVALLLGVEGLPAAAARDPLKPVWLSPLKADNSFDAIVAPDKKHVWAFGQVGAGVNDKPLIYRKSGAKWVRAALPAGLRGGVDAASASSAKNVWAVGSDTSAKKPTYLLRWNGERWKVVRRWDAHVVYEIVATPGGGAWAFDTMKPRALRFDGKRWRQVKTPVTIRSATVHGKTLWAWGDDKDGQSKVVRFDGTRWTTVDPGSLLPPQTEKDSFTFYKTLAVVAGEVWLTAGHYTDLEDPEAPVQAFLLRYADGAWHREAPGLDVGLELHEAVPDGKGGLWFLGLEDIPAADGISRDAFHLVHRARSGRWTRRYLGRNFRGTPGLSDFALIPGTKQLIGVGHIEPPSTTYTSAVYRLN